MTDDQITVPRETAQVVFDALVNSMDFGSGFLDTPEVEALRGLAVALGVDPDTATPSLFKARYPHTFDAATDRDQIADMFGALTRSRALSVTGAPYTVNTVDESAMPDYVPCKVGTWSAYCRKPECDPIHQTA